MRAMQMTVPSPMKAAPDDAAGRTLRRRRRPVFTLTREQVCQRCQEGQHEMICAGQVLAVMELMRCAGWPIAVLARRARVSASHLSEFLRVESFLTVECAFRVARAFGLRLSTLVHLAEDHLEA